MPQSRPRTPSITLPFIVISTLPLGERDIILRIVEPETGRRSIVLRGARTSKPRQSPRLDLFDRAIGTLSLRMTGMSVLTSCERQSPFQQLRTDLTKFAAANLLAESVTLLFEEHTEADPSLYNLLEESLTGINAEDSPRGTLRILTESLLRLLDLSGFGNSELLHARLATRPPSPRILRMAIIEIEKAAGRALRSAPTIGDILDRLARSGSTP